MFPKFKTLTFGVFCTFCREVVWELKQRWKLTHMNKWIQRDLLMSSRGTCLFCSLIFRSIRCVLVPGRHYYKWICHFKANLMHVSDVYRQWEEPRRRKPTQTCKLHKERPPGVVDYTIDLIATHTQLYWWISCKLLNFCPHAQAYLFYTEAHRHVISFKHMPLETHYFTHLQMSQPCIRRQTTQRHTHLTIKHVLFTHTLAHTQPWLPTAELVKASLFLLLIHINISILHQACQAIIKAVKQCFFHYCLSYNPTPTVTRITSAQGKTPAQIPAVVCPPRQASWVGKVPLSIWTCPQPAEQKGQRASSAPVSPPSNSGGKLFGASWAAGWTSLVVSACSKISTPRVFVRKFSFISGRGFADFTGTKQNKADKAGSVPSIVSQWARTCADVMGQKSNRVVVTSQTSLHHNPTRHDCCCTLW